jgi:hypothetical protein
VACVVHCRLATTRDPEAAFVFYTASNQPTFTTAPATPATPAETSSATRARGNPHYRNDHLQTLPGFQALPRRFPSLEMGEVIGDAGALSMMTSMRSARLRCAIMNRTLTKRGGA